MRIPKAVIPKFAGVKTDLLTDADNSDLRKAIKDAVPAAVEQTKDLAEYFKATNERETCKRIFDYLKQNVEYKADDWRQVVQMPSAIMRKGAIADCKSLSLFTAAILQNLGIPWHFVLASYTDSAIPGHIYVETDSGCIIDVVWGKFDQEKKANHRYNMKVSYLSGITGPMVASNEGITGRAERQQRRAARQEKRQERRETRGTTVARLGLAPGRNLFLVLVKANIDGIATKLSKLDFEKVKTSWIKAGGKAENLQNAIKSGSQKRAKKVGFLSLLAKKSKKNVAGIYGSVFDEKALTIALPAAATAVGTAVNPGAGTAAGTSLGAVMVKMVPIIIAVLQQLTPSEDSATIVAQKLGADELSNEDQGSDIEGGEGSTGKTTTFIIIGAAVAIGAFLYFRKKK